MTLKPLVRELSYCHIPPAISAAVVLCLLAAAFRSALLGLPGRCFKHLSGT